MAFRKLKNIVGAALTCAVASTIVLTAAPAQALRPVEPTVPYQGQVSCEPGAKPGTIALSKKLMKKFGGRSLGIARSCSTGGLSEHKEGRAFDWGLNAASAKDRKTAAAGIKWLTETRHGVANYRAKRWGVMYIIWNKKMWRAYDPAAGWQPYKGASPHTDHVHISLTWSGAMKNSSKWRSPYVTDFGPCRPWLGEMAKPWRAVRTVPCPDLLRRPVANAQGYYVAQRGETVERVAKFFKISPATVRQLNAWPATGYVQIHAGQKVRVRPAVR